MRCPKCQLDNPDGARFCNECGHGLEISCRVCGNVNPPAGKFCNECGHSLKNPPDVNPVVHPETSFPGDESVVYPDSIKSERKHVTVLFSDLSGYTGMSEKLDPEEVKEIMNRIFGEVARIVTRYEGIIDKFIGDAVMALFGVPKTHEDDPFRAIMAAREIHDVVEAISPQLEEKIGRSISVHTGINTGLVVTDKMDIEKGKHGMTGDAINLASRLTDMAGAGEILIGPDTYRHAEGFFNFEGLESTRIKGKAEPVEVYKVLSAKERPVKIHRLSGLRADLIGRETEMSCLVNAVVKLKDGNSSIFSICGDAGTGKSRLVEAFRATLDLGEVQWREGHAYAYSQNIPYFPLIDFLNRLFQIKEGDSAEKVKEKIESSIKSLLGNRDDVIPYIGSLYGLNYPEVEEMSPELWKSCLQKAIHAILSGLAQERPTIICLEDLHWADPSSVEFLRLILSDFRNAVLFLCVYRPPFSLFTGHEPGGMEKVHNEIRLRDLSPSDAQEMVESLLKTDMVPLELKKFVQEKVEGNPFYLEEVINSLIESGTLSRGNGIWKLTRPIVEAAIPSTLQGVISARLDRFERETKKVLQEASVAGRAFLYDILKRITEHKGSIDRCLRDLERLDVIKTRFFQPDIEYIFKHALTQDVVYNGLLKKERRAIHERIALVMEELFRDRISEFYEILAFHFKRGQSVLKAVEYLVKSGEKNLARYSLDESHQYYKEAFELLSNETKKTGKEEVLLISLLNKWSIVFNQRGDYSRLIDLLKDHEKLADSLDDKEHTGMFYGWLGWALRQREELKEAYQYLCKSLRYGEEIKNRKVIGYACAWLSQTCSDLGLLDEAIIFGKRAQEMSDLLESDQLFFQFSMVGMGLAYYFRGERKKEAEIGKILLDYGQKQSDIRSSAMGNNITGLGHLTAGDFPFAIESFQRSVQVSLDPMISCLSQLFLGMGYLSNNQFREAEETLEEVMRFNDDFGLEAIGTSAEALKGVILIARGDLRQGIRITENALRVWFENGSRYRYATLEHQLGKVYFELIYGERRKTFSLLTKNIVFLIKSVPFAAKKAESHFNKAIEISREIGAKGILGQANLDLGRLHKAKGRTDQARKCIEEAVNIFERCEAKIYLKQAEENLSSL